MELEKAINKRRSIRKFKEKKPDWRKILDALDSATKASLAGNIQVLRFILISDKDKIKRIADACQQDFVGHVHYIVVFCSDDEQIKRAYGERGLMYSKQQVGAAIQNFLLSLTEMKLATCWVGAFSESMIRNILDIPDNIGIQALFPIGYEAGNVKSKYKMPLDRLLYFDKWKERHMKPLKKIEAV